MTVAELESVLRRALAQPLPGAAAQRDMAPRPRPGWRPAGPSDIRRLAAALLLIYPGADGASIVLTTRSGGLSRHSGQVSLPGGAVSAGESPADAALREAAEEVGVDPAAIRVLGVLTPLDIPVSGFLLHPVVGVTDHRPDFLAADGEVERVLEVPVAHLLDPARVGFDQRLRDGVHHDIPFFGVGGEVVWGATAMVLSEFLWLLGWRPAGRSA
ncbi:MAG: CoA pyrophosphatase [Planctomycetes bacterium]|nr:CoA pyrophosphatase [Planctomycetota bacterium]